MTDKKKVILTCSVCLSRNYTTNKNSNNTSEIEKTKHSLEELNKQNFDKKFYDPNSIMVQRKNDILELCQKLNNIIIKYTL